MTQTTTGNDWLSEHRPAPLAFLPAPFGLRCCSSPQVTPSLRYSSVCRQKSALTPCSYSPCLSTQLCNWILTLSRPSSSSPPSSAPPRQPNQTDKISVSASSKCSYIPFFSLLDKVSTEPFTVFAQHPFHCICYIQLCNPVNSNPNVITNLISSHCKVSHVIVETVYTFTPSTDFLRTARIF